MRLAACGLYSRSPRGCTYIRTSERTRHDNFVNKKSKVEKRFFIFSVYNWGASVSAVGLPDDTYVAANKCASSARIDLQNGCWNTLASHRGKELLGAAVLPSFAQHRWVSADCGKLEVRLLKGQQQPSSKKFLWNLKELEMCELLKK